MRRYQALELLQAFDWPSWKRLTLVRWELASLEREIEEFTPLPPPDEDAAYEQWRLWREGMIRKYWLGSLLSSDSTNL